MAKISYVSIMSLMHQMINERPNIQLIMGVVSQIMAHLCCKKGVPCFMTLSRKLVMYQRNQELQYVLS